MKTHFWQSTRVAGSRRCRLARLRATIPLVVLGLACGLTLGGLQEAAGGLPGYFTDVKPVANINSTSESIPQAWPQNVARWSGTVLHRDGKQERNGETADMWVATRDSTSQEFREPVKLGPGVNTDVAEAIGQHAVGWPDAFTSRSTSRRYSRDFMDIFVVTRSSKDEEFGNAMPLDSINNVGPAGTKAPFPSADELTIYYTSVGVSPDCPGFSDGGLVHVDAKRPGGRFWQSRPAGRRQHAVRDRVVPVRVFGRSLSFSSVTKLARLCRYWESRRCRCVVRNTQQHNGHV